MIVDDKQIKNIEQEANKNKGSESSADKKDDSNYNFEDVSIDSSCLYECYYCDEFAPTDNRDAYEKRVILYHDEKLAYPSKTDIEKNNLKLQGKYWEI